MHIKVEKNELKQKLNKLRFKKRYTTKTKTKKRIDILNNIIENNKQELEHFKRNEMWGIDCLTKSELAKKTKLNIDDYELYATCKNTYGDIGYIFKLKDKNNI